MTHTRFATAPSIAATAALLLAALGGSPQAGAQGNAAAELREGVDYRAINPPQPTMTSEEGKIEVAEIFQYGCPGCFSIEPHIEQWKARKADYVNLVRLPASWNPLARVHAQAYYTAEALGKVDEMHQAFFNEVHVERNTLDNEAALADFFARFGVDEETFTKTFNSFSVHTKVQRADELIRRYRVGETPNFVVNGKYLTSGTMAGSYERWFDIIDSLAAQEQQGRSE